ncbi:MAG TPA: acyl-CoA dehydrogenase family protein [Longimicrobiales bacterium]
MASISTDAAVTTGAAEAESPEQAEIRALARDFAASELRPHVERWDHERRIDEAVRAQLAELGFFGISIPDRFGGMGLDDAAVSAIVQELAWGEPAVALVVSLQVQASGLLVQHGTDDQRTTWLERMATGDAHACLAFAEDAGAEAEELRTTAQRAGDGYVLNGTKRWVTGAADATFALVLARVDEGQGIFLVPMDASGVSIGQADDTLGLRSLPITSLILKDCAVPADSLLGGTAAAADQMASVAMHDQLCIASIAAGIAEAASEYAIGYANEREQFGRKLRTFEGIQFKLAGMTTRTAAARALLASAALSGDAQRTRMAKVFSTETAMDVTTQAVQVYGGYGYMRDYPVEKLMRDAKAMEMLGGANELLRVAVAEALYRD